MLTIEGLRECGADIDSGMARCMNNEAFYLKLAGMALEDRNFEKLEDAILNNNLDEAFEAAHALKGMLGNVSLNSVLEPALEMTDALRRRDDIDYSGYLAKMKEELEKLRGL